MVFENENTWHKAVTSGRTEEFHREYEEALERVKGELGKRYPLYIGGKEKYSQGGEFADACPSDTRIVLGYFQRGTREDAREAIAAAKAAFPAWSGTDYTERLRTFRRVADVICRSKFDLAALITLENGKSRFEAVADVDEAADLIRFYCEEMEENDGFEREMRLAFPNEKARSIMKPYGVWGVISPFNFPLAIAVGMSSGAMIAGNTVVFKPASDTPLVGLRYYQITQEAGLPKGVLNYVTGSGEVVGAELVENPEVSGIVFTGSKAVGVSSYEAFSKRAPRPFIAEMGGKNPVIVTAKADLKKAAEGIARAAFGYGGQKCSACSRVYVDKRVEKEFLETLVKMTRELRVGDPALRDNFMGPLINESAYKRYLECAERARREGTVLTGGRALTDDEHKQGYFVEPTIVEGPRKDHPFFKEELFVPILCVAEVDSLDEAMELCNEVEYGLTAGIFSEDEGEVERFFHKVQAGVLYANRRVGATTGAMVGAQPFVGWKFSGSSGRGAGGHYYIQQFMREQSQTVCK